MNKIKPNLEHYWLPFTPNRHFKKNPRMLTRSQGMHYWDDKGNKILDSSAGLWCVNAGHNPPSLVEAIQKQAQNLDYATAFQVAHEGAFELAEKLAHLAPQGMNRVFYTNSGSEAADTSLKIALAYHHSRGESSRYRLIGREKAYHGVNFGGISVGGMPANRKVFGPMVAGCAHICHTLDIEHNRFTKGLPDYGEHFADDFARLVQHFDPSTVAALIVEPISCSGGVIMPPKGYLQKLRDYCTQYGILLIFDEVITAFGRLGGAFSSDVFGVVPDMINIAKGLTNGAVPMGAVIIKQEIYDSLMQADEDIIELFHGYTYSGHPLACAAAKASLDIYKNESLFERAKQLAPYFEQAIHSLKDHPKVVDIRNYGLVGAVQLEAIKNKPGFRTLDVHIKGFNKGILFRASSDVIALSPPLIVQKKQIDQMIDVLIQAIDEAV